MRRILVLAALLAAAASTAGAALRAQHDCVRGGGLFFNAADRTKLVGHRFGKGTTAVILTHQSGRPLRLAPVCEAPGGARLLRLPDRLSRLRLLGHAALGPVPLRAGHRGRGEALRRLGKKKIFVVGASMGGIAAVVAGSNVSPPLAGVVSVSSPARFRGMDGVKASRGCTCVLYLAATADDNAGYDFSENAETLHRAAASKDKRLELLPGSLHGIAVRRRLRTRESVDRAFLKGN